MNIQGTIVPLPSVEELTRRYGRHLDNPGLRAIREWAIPNSAADTDENEVNATLQEQDTAKFLNVVRNVVKQLRESHD
jgi:hypothetical protein